MSELIHKNDNRATIRWKLLTGASALALTAYVASANMVKAEDADHPVLWLELGGQAEMEDGLSAPFSAPFMTAISPTPDIYEGDPFLDNQRDARFAFGGEGKITFQSENSDWQFSAGIRYGRSHAQRHRHNQGDRLDPVHYTYNGQPYGSALITILTVPLADAKSRLSEHHIILDFQAGKDVGLGLLGRGTASTINAGVRFASFSSSAHVRASGRPEVDVQLYPIFSGLVGWPTAVFHNYTMYADSHRTFRGVGPSISWNASAPLAGNKQDGELSLDWGINGAVLFGKQKAKVSHTTQAYYHSAHKYSPSQYSITYQSPHHSTRSRSITVPNIGGYASLSLQWTNAKVSIGYRYDTFLKAMDTGIDARKTSNATFNGPFASISVGLGD